MVAVGVVVGRNGLGLAAWTIAATAVLVPASERGLVRTGGSNALFAVCNVAATPGLLRWALTPATDMATELVLVLLAADPRAVMTASESGAVAHTLTGRLVQI